MVREIFKGKDGHIYERKVEVTYEPVDYDFHTGKGGWRRIKHVLSEEICTDTQIISRYYPP